MPPKKTKKKKNNLKEKVKSLEAALAKKDKEYARKDALNEILREFDFEKVERVCEFLDWQVYNPRTHQNEAVSVQGLIDDARDFAKECWKAFDEGKATEEWIVHSGPLKLWWCECKEGIFAELTFVCEEWRVEPIEPVGAENNP